MANKWYSSWVYTKIISRFFLPRYKNDPKKRDELAHWIGQALKKEDNDHFNYFYTKEFGLQESFYKDKKILDLGCGPAGSLEWANTASERIGLDPLANDYLKLGAWKHKMKYVNGVGEDMPFEDNYFDVIFSYNALDHVDDLDKTISEIKRVLNKGGHLLIITDSNHEATITEPAFIPLDFIERHFSDYKIKSHEFFEHTMLRTYDSLLKKRKPVNKKDLEANKQYIIKAHLINE